MTRRPSARKNYAYLVILLVTIALIGIGGALALPSLQALGAVVLGLGMIAVGLEAVRTRFFEMAPGSILSSSRFRFRGVGAVFWGLQFIGLGLGTLAVAGVVLLDLVSSVESLILDRPGIAITPIGFVFLCTAIGWLSGEESMNASIFLFIVTLPHRIGAVVTLLFALAVLCIGIFELAQPEVFDQIVESLRPPPFPPLPTP